MKKFNKVLSLVLAFVILFGSLPIGVMAGPIDSRNTITDENGKVSAVLARAIARENAKKNRALKEGEKKLETDAKKIQGKIDVEFQKDSSKKRKVTNDVNKKLKEKNAGVVDANGNVVFKDSNSEITMQDIFYDLGIKSFPIMYDEGDAGKTNYGNEQLEVAGQKTLQELIEIDKKRHGKTYNFSGDFRKWKDEKMLGINSTSKRNVTNVPFQTLDYLGFLQLIYHWSDLELVNDKGYGYVKRRSTDKSNDGDLATSPPDTKYDIAFEFDEGNGLELHIYSMFGFKGINEDTVNKDFPGRYAKIVTHDVSKYNAPYYIDLNMERKDDSAMFDAPAMGKVPADAKFMVADYSTPGLESKKITRADFQFAHMSQEFVDAKAKIANPNQTNSKYTKANLYDKNSPGKKLSSGATATEFMPLYDGVFKGRSGAFVSFGNVIDSIRFRDRDTQKDLDFANSTFPGNYRTAGVYDYKTDRVLFDYVDSDQYAGSREWHFVAYKIDIGESDDEDPIPYLSYLLGKLGGGDGKVVIEKELPPPDRPPEIPPEDPPIDPEDPKKPGEPGYKPGDPNNPGGNPDNKTDDDPTNPKDPDPRKKKRPDISVEIPEEGIVDLEIDIDWDPKDPDPDPDKKPDNEIEEPEDPNPGNKKKKKGKNPIIEVTPEIEVNEDSSPDKKTEVVVEQPNPITPPNKGKVKVKIKPNIPEGEETKVCMKLKGDAKRADGTVKNEEFDEVCLDIKVTEDKTDIGMDAGKTTVSGNGVDNEKKTYKKDSTISIGFAARHISGNKEAGKKTPIVADITAKDLSGKTIYTGKASLNGTLKPGESKEFNKVQFRPSGEGFIACAKLDESLAKAGENVKNGNDEACVTYMLEDTSKNYSLRDAIATPQSVSRGKNEGNKQEKVKVAFTVGNDSNPGGKDALPASVQYKVSVNGNVKNGTVSVGPGQVQSKVENFDVYLREGENKIKVEINPNRNPQEKASNGQDPYKDNVKKITVYMYSYLDTCLKDKDLERNRVRQGQQQRFTGMVDYKVDYTYDYTYSKQVGTRPEPIMEYRQVGVYPNGMPNFQLVQVGTRQVPVYRTETVRNQSGYNKFTEEVRLTESISKAEAYFRSKLTYDKAGVPENQRKDSSTQGWVKLAGNEDKVKNGYGFELKYEYEYKLTPQNGRSMKDQVSVSKAKEVMERGYPQNAPWGLKDFQIIPGSKRYRNHSDIKFDTSTTPEVFAKLPALTEGGKPICIKMDRYKSNKDIDGNTKMEFRLPEIQNIDGNGKVRKVFTRKAQGSETPVGNIEISATPIIGFPNWKVTQGQKKPLQPDITRGPLYILGNDDVKTHITR